MITRFLLVRHGEVAGHWTNRVYGCLDVSLSPAGELEARRAAALVLPSRPVAVVSSGLQRTVYGAAQISDPLGVAHHRDSDLREIERGDWAGRSTLDIEAAQPGALGDWFRAPATTRPPGGESLADLSSRVVPRIEHWSSEYPGATLAIVAHLWVIRVAVCRALEVDLDAATRLAVPTGELVVIDWPSVVESEKPVVGESGRPRPTLVGFGIDDVPAGTSWFDARRRAKSGR